MNRPVGWILIVVATVLVGAALWLSLILPVREEVRNLSTDGMTIAPEGYRRLLHQWTTRSNIWGTPLWQTRRTIVTPGTGLPPEELIDEGPVIGKNQHGEWTMRIRSGAGPWQTIRMWYWRGQQMNEAEWKRK